MTTNLEIISSESYSVEKFNLKYKGELFQVEIITGEEDSTWIECNVMQDGEHVEDVLAEEISEALDKVLSH